MSGQLKNIREILSDLQNDVPSCQKEVVVGRQRWVKLSEEDCLSQWSSPKVSGGSSSFRAYLGDAEWRRDHEEEGFKNEYKGENFWH